MNEVIACSLPDAVRRGRERDIRQMLLAVVEEVVELKDGYALRFPGESRWVRVAAELMALERECCRFLSLTLVAEPSNGPVWLKLRGPEGTKAFLEAGFGLGKSGPSPR